MDHRIAIIGIILENPSESENVNRLLSGFREYIVGRMGLPYSKRDVCVISIVIDAPSDVINALTGKLAMCPGVSAKAVYSKKQYACEVAEV